MNANDAPENEDTFAGGLDGSSPDPVGDTRSRRRRLIVLGAAVAVAAVVIGTTTVTMGRGGDSESRGVTVGQNDDTAVDEAASMARRSAEASVTSTTDTTAAPPTTTEAPPEPAPVAGGGGGIQVPSGGGAYTPPPATGGGGSYTPPPPPPPVETYSQPSVSWTITSCSYQPSSPTTGTLVVNWTWNVTGGSGWQVVNSPASPYYHPVEKGNPYQVGIPPPLSPVVIRTDTGEPVLLGGRAPYFSNYGIVPTGCAGWS
jgi:hypothetical protein